MLMDFFAALGCRVPFRLAWRRARHIRHGHPLSRSILIDSLRSDKHPRSDLHWVFTVNIYKCDDCGLHYLDEGVELRPFSAP